MVSFKAFRFCSCHTQQAMGYSFFTSEQGTTELRGLFTDKEGVEGTFSPHCCSPGRWTIFSSFWKSPFLHWRPFSPVLTQHRHLSFSSHLFCICAVGAQCIFLGSDRQRKKLTASSDMLFPCPPKNEKIRVGLGWEKYILKKSWKPGWCQENIYGLGRENGGLAAKLE